MTAPINNSQPSIYFPQKPTTHKEKNIQPIPKIKISDEDFARTLQNEELSKHGKTINDLKGEFDKFTRSSVPIKKITPDTDVALPFTKLELAKATKSQESFDKPHLKSEVETLPFSKSEVERATQLQKLFDTKRLQSLDLALPFSKSELKIATQLQERFDAQKTHSEKTTLPTIPTFNSSKPLEQTAAVTTITPYMAAKDTINIINHGNVHFNPRINGKEKQAPGDGSCMYHSIIMALKEQRPDFKISVSELRQSTADYIRNMDLAFFTKGKAERKEIADAQAKGTWGDNFALLAVSNLLNTNITVSFN